MQIQPHITSQHANNVSGPTGDIPAHVSSFAAEMLSRQQGMTPTSSGDHLPLIPIPSSPPISSVAKTFESMHLSNSPDVNSKNMGRTTAMMTIPSKNVLRNFHRFHQDPIKVLLLENISNVSIELLNEAGFQVESLKHALSETQLIEKIQEVQVLGIRSKSKITAKVIQHAKKLLVIACFCIGTNQVDIVEASHHGICVLNSPYANSRSVAEMTLGNCIALARQLGDRNREMHQGVWNKVSSNCFELRGKTIGIVGHGHIGSQLSVLSESLGMKVVYHDILQIMPIGTAQQLDSLDQVLKTADIVTLHVPETPETHLMIKKEQLKLMKKGAFLINASRGSVVEVNDLAEALHSGQLGGAAIDVYPTEPASNGPDFKSPLIGCPNTILTPHIGGSTEEAQRAIGYEVSKAVITYINEGATINSVNLPALQLKHSLNDLTVRITNVHKNVPGVLRNINKLLSQFNIEKQSSEAQGDIAYFMADVTLQPGSIEDELNQIYHGISSLQENILSRVFY
ncbi:hypothetical protein HMI56_002157 [Coelomomyces lativittatus]|nr:hypothetical protein HMI56_002157 [Coelomomyces lativittatus]